MRTTKAGITQSEITQVDADITKKDAHSSGNSSDKHFMFIKLNRLPRHVVHEFAQHGIECAYVGEQIKPTQNNTFTIISLDSDGLTVTVDNVNSLFRKLLYVYMNNNSPDVLWITICKNEGISNEGNKKEESLSDLVANVDSRKMLTLKNTVPDYIFVKSKLTSKITFTSRNTLFEHILNRGDNILPIVMNNN